MIQMRLEVLEHAHMAGVPGFVLPGAGHTGKMDVNTMAQEHRVTQGATTAMPRFTILSMPAVSDTDAGA